MSGRVNGTLCLFQCLSAGAAKPRWGFIGYLKAPACVRQRYFYNTHSQSHKQSHTHGDGLMEATADVTRAWHLPLPDATSTQLSGLGMCGYSHKPQNFRELGRHRPGLGRRGSSATRAAPDHAPDLSRPHRTCHRPGTTHATRDLRQTASAHDLRAEDCREPMTASRGLRAEDCEPRTASRGRGEPGAGLRADKNCQPTYCERRGEERTGER